MPVADILAYSPHLPLPNDYLEQKYHITAEDEEIMLALRYCDRVRSIWLLVAVPNFGSSLWSWSPNFRFWSTSISHLINISYHQQSINRVFFRTSRAPNLRHLVHVNFVIPIISPLMTAAGLVALSLLIIHLCTYFRPNDPTIFTRALSRDT